MCPRIEVKLVKLLDHHGDGGAAMRAIYGGAEGSRDDDEGQLRRRAERTASRRMVLMAN